MTSTIEMIDKQTGLLSPEMVISDQITHTIAHLHTIMEMLPPGEGAAKKAIQDQRNSLCEVRSYLEKHFAFKPKD